MAYKIAIASSDGKVINQHFGRAEVFYIGEVGDNGDFRFLEELKTNAVCHGGEHEADAINAVAEKLSDCRYVLVCNIGPGAEYLLNQKGVTVFTVRDYIENAIIKLTEYDNKITAFY